MKTISHSEITTYLDCQKKWELQYIKGLKSDNIHFQFGSMAHKVMETRIIPDEMLYPELKEAFGINSWEHYFKTIFSEIDTYFKEYDVIGREVRVELDNMVGVIDVIWKNKITGKYLITDYKFSNSTKTLVDVYLDEQMYIYASSYAVLNNLTLADIEIGYINIPKKDLDTPRVLKTGQLSKDRAQNCSYDEYYKKIIELNLNVDDYKDFLEEIKSKKLLQISISPINEDMCVRAIKNIDEVIKDMEKGYVLEKCSYLCKYCEFLQECKYKENINDV